MEGEEDMSHARFSALDLHFIQGNCLLKLGA
jgi:hypothetical protein